MSKEDQEVEVTAKVGKIDGKNAIEVEAKMNDQLLQTTRFIYEETERMILENMPQETLETLHKQLAKEIKRRKREKN